MDPTVQVALISALVAVVGMFAEGWRRQHKVLSEVHENSREAKEQVKNSHTTNLRDDLDHVRDQNRALHDQLSMALRTVLEAQRELAQEMTGMRADMRQERDERLEVARRLEQHRVEVARQLAELD